MPEPRCPWCQTTGSQHPHVGGSTDCFNAWVARDVLGCRVGHSKETGFRCGCAQRNPWEPPPHGWTSAHDALAEFSGEIGPAWQVVERMEDRRDTHVQLDNTGRGWVFHVWKHGHEYAADAETAPLAICHTALLATLAPTHGDPR